MQRGRVCPPRAWFGQLANRGRRLLVRSRLERCAGTRVALSKPSFLGCQLPCMICSAEGLNGPVGTHAKGSGVGEDSVTAYGQLTAKDNALRCDGAAWLLGNGETMLGLGWAGSRSLRDLEAEVHEVSCARWMGRSPTDWTAWS